MNPPSSLSAVLVLGAMTLPGTGAAGEIGGGAGGAAAVAPGTEPPLAVVQQVRIAPAAEGTRVSIRVDRPVSARAFALADPPRLVVDLEGARHALPRFSYGAIGRGGIVSMRSSQFQEDVVRLVFETTSAPKHGISRAGSEGEVVIQLLNGSTDFAPWSTADPEASVPGGGAPPDAGPAGGGGRTSALRPGASPRDGDGADRAPGVPSEDRGAADRAPAADAPAGAPEMRDRRASADGGRPPLLTQEQQPRISVTYDSATMLDVLAGFSEFSGMSIVPSSEAAGETVRGVSITDQPWDVALDAILSAQGLEWQRVAPGIIMVDQLEALRGRDTLQTETRVLRINYASADSVSSVLQQLATERGKVVAYEGANSVIVTDMPSVVGRMDSLVNALDRRTPQVSIEAKIIFVDRTTVNQLGIVYDLKDQSAETGFSQLIPTEGLEPGESPPEELPYTVNVGGPALAALANANDPIANPALRILVNTVFGGFSLSAFVDALRSYELSDVEAAPSIQVVDNYQASIQVGERTPIRVLEPSAQLQQARVNVQFEDTGIILRTTPHVTNNRQVLLDLHAERSGLQVGLADVGFNFDKQVGETRLLLNDGETGAIAGLTLSEVTRSESGIPLLMDLPVVGGLFRTSRNQERKQDLIILVTPHIVEAGDAASTR